MATSISQAQLENDVTEWSKTLSDELDDDAKQKAINDYRAETLKKAKQKKAKESAEGKPRQRQPLFLAKLGTSQVLLPSKFHLRFPPGLLAAARSAQLCLQDL